MAAKRDREWLVRWLKVPDEMLAEKDPLAMALFVKYRELPMPNLKLNDIDAVALIEYLDTESHRVGKSTVSDAHAQAR